MKAITKEEEESAIRNSIVVAENPVDTSTDSAKQFGPIWDETKERDTLADALAAIQWQLRNLKTDAMAAGYGYLSLPKLLSQVYKYSGGFGIAISFTMECLPSDMLSVTAIAVHRKTGKEMRSSVFARISKEDIPINRDGKPVMNFMQWFGSCVTYMRRYSLQNLLGISAESDDDAAASLVNEKRYVR
jgi:hypothetical protein